MINSGTEDDDDPPSFPLDVVEDREDEAMEEEFRTRPRTHRGEDDKVVVVVGGVLRRNASVVVVVECPPLP